MTRRAIISVYRKEGIVELARGLSARGFEIVSTGGTADELRKAKIKVTGNKATQRFYYRHSTYPGGLKAVALGDVLSKHPEDVIKHSVRGMLPHNALGRKMLRKLKIYAGSEHPHAAQFRAYEKQQRTATEEQP